MAHLVPQQDAFMRDLAKLIQRARRSRFLLTGGELWRTREQQQVYYLKGLSTVMNSQHLKRLAVDLNFFKVRLDGSLELTYDKDDLQKIGDYWESLSPENRWGGNWQEFVDTAHFERREV